MRTYTIEYTDGKWRNIYADRVEDNGKEFVYYVPKKYVVHSEKERSDEVLPLPRTSDE